MASYRSYLCPLAVALTLLLWSCPTLALEPIVVEAVQLPDYEAVRGIRRYATPDEYNETRADQRFRLERMTYTSDGLRVSAYVYRPARATDRLPVIVFNRGSWVVKDQAPALLTMFRRLGNAGFLVLAPMLRGSDGAEGRDEMGGAELADISNAVAAARSRYEADFDNLFLYGESRGGMMVFLALQRGMPARAAATFGTITDFELHFGEAPDQAALAPRIWPDYELKKAEILRTRSALKWAEDLRVPLLLLNGGADQTVSPSQAMMLAARLQQLKYPYAVTIYAYDNHALTANRVDRDQRVVEWFKHHLRTVGIKNEPK